MKAAVLGCGESTSNWSKSDYGISIGVNDCFKFGTSPDYLLLLDSPNRFTDDRITVIKNTESKFILNSHIWDPYLKKKKKEYIQTQSWRGKYKEGSIYSSKSSPFVAMSILIKHGYKDIDLYGVDFNSHHHFKDEIAELEIINYVGLIKMADVNVRVTKSSKLSKYLKSI